MKDKKLVARIFSGDKKAFEIFYKEHVQGLTRFVGSKVGEGVDVEETVQDAFLSFLDSLPLFSFRSTLKTFLYSIARHEVADYFRRKYAKRALKLVPIVGEYVSRELYTTHELSAAIDGVYRKILPEYAVILQMKYEEGMSVKEIARKMKLSVKASESRLFRARKAFQLEYANVGIRN